MTATLDTSSDHETGGHGSDYARLMAEIRDLGLERYIGELDVQGYTVVPPEFVGDEATRKQRLQAVLDAAEQVDGTRPDLETGEPYIGIGHHGRSLATLLGRGRLFEEAVMDPVILAFATYLCGYSCVINASTALLKGPGGRELELHTDAQIAIPMPGPLPPYSVVANCTLNLTDYTLDNGCLAVVPGSHKRAIPATGPEALLLENPEAIPVECPAGSLIVWHANLWHGAYPRTVSGLRVALTLYYARWWLRTQEHWIGKLSDEVLARNPPRFATVTGQNIRFGYSSPEEAAVLRERAASFAEAPQQHAADGDRAVLDFSVLPSLWG